MNMNHLSKTLRYMPVLTVCFLITTTACAEVRAPFFLPE